MVRSTSVLLAIAILPGSLTAQQDVGTHTVVPGNTLWGIAGQYYENPFLWPRIHEANLDLIENPHRIYPGWVVRVPGLPADAAVAPTVVDPGPIGAVPAEPVAAAVPDPEPVAATPPPPAPTGALARAAGPARPMQVQAGANGIPRTVFYQEPQVVQAVGDDRALWDVPPADFYSAPWLIAPGTVPARAGMVLDAGGTARGASSRMELSSKPYDRVQVQFDGTPPAVGTALLSFRLQRDIENVGHVVAPTGLLEVEALAPGGVVALVLSSYDRILPGDLIRIAPPYTPRPHGTGIPVTGGEEAIVLGFERPHAVQPLGGHVFLDRGAAEGVNIGDEYVALAEGSEAFPSTVEGRVKVVSVLENVSTARIVEVTNPVFVAGVRLRPNLRMR